MTRAIGDIFILVLSTIFWVPIIGMWWDGRQKMRLDKEADRLRVLR